MRFRSLFTSTFALALAAVSCGDETDGSIYTPFEPIPEQGGGEPTPQDLEPTVSFALSFFEEGTGDPVVAAGVAVDLKDGTRLEGLTDAQGRVSFEAGVADVEAFIAFRFGAPFFGATGDVLADRYGATNLPHAPAAIAMKPMYHPTETTRLSGTAEGMVGPYTLVVSSTAPGASRYQAPGDAWFLDVPKAGPFQVIATERQSFSSKEKLDQRFLGWTTLDPSRLRDDTRRDELTLDFGQSIAPETSVGTFASLADPTMVHEGVATFTVTSVESKHAAALGFPTYLARSEVGRTFEYEAEWIELPGQTLETVYQIVAGGGSTSERASFAVDAGPPADGMMGLRLLEPPVILRTGATAIDPIWWTLPVPLDEHGAVRIAFEQAGLGEVGAFVVAPDTTHARVPALPSVVDPSTVMRQGVTVRVRIEDCGPDEPCRWAYDTRFLATY